MRIFPGGYSRNDIPGMIFPGGNSWEDIPERIFLGGYSKEDIPRRIFQGEYVGKLRTLLGILQRILKLAQIFEYPYLHC